MKICYDGIGLSHFKNTSLYTYTFELLNRLPNLYPQAEYKVVSNKHISHSPLLNDKVDFLKINLNRLDNDYNLLESYLTDGDIDIYHSPNNGFSLPAKKVCKYILTMHNLLPISQPKYVDIKYYDKFNTLVPISLQKADKIIAISKFIKDEILRHFNISEDKVIVIHPALSEMFKPMNKKKCRFILKTKYDIDEDFLLFTGSIHERKNLDTIFIVFKKILNYYSNLKLLIVGNNLGKKQELFLSLQEYAKELNIHDNIIFTGLVDYEDMPYIYNSALCLINISDYEGFPTSTLEGAACGTPVVCSNSSSFREVLGKSAIYIENKDIDTLKNILLETIDRKNDDLQKRDTQILKYRGDNSIRELVRVYESIV